MSYDFDTKKLTIEGFEMEVAFEVATHQALADMRSEFTFDGYTISTAAAVDAVHEIRAGRTYH